MTTFNIHTPRDPELTFRTLELHQLFALRNDFTAVYIKLDGNLACAINSSARIVRPIASDQRVIRISHIDAYIDGAPIPIKEAQ